jgi:hypothetical protein
MTRNILMGRNGGMVEEGIGIWRGGRTGRNFGRRKRSRGFFCGASKLLRQSVVQEDLCLNNKPCEQSPCYPD